MPVLDSLNRRSWPTTPGWELGLEWYIKCQIYRLAISFPRQSCLPICTPECAHNAVHYSHHSNSSHYTQPQLIFSTCLLPMCSWSRCRYDIGATSSVLTQLESSTYSGVSWYEVVANSTLLQGVITSSGVLGEELTHHLGWSVIYFSHERARSGEYVGDIASCCPRSHVMYTARVRGYSTQIPSLISSG